MNTLLKFIVACSTAGALAGCAGTGSAVPEPAPASASTPAPAPAPAPAAPVAAPSPDQMALKEGIDLYNKGDFNGAIKRLGASDIAAGSTKIQLEALKYQAFSYCVTARKTQCRKQFEKALKLDPSFDLALGEHGHPLWGPVFARLKKPK